MKISNDRRGGVMAKDNLQSPCVPPLAVIAWMEEENRRAREREAERRRPRIEAPAPVPAAVDEGRDAPEDN